MSQSSEERRLFELGGEDQHSQPQSRDLPSALADIKALFRTKTSRSCLYGTIIFVVVVFCWGVVWIQEATAIPKRQQWRPADPVFPLSVLHDMDRHADPCTNFYRFACHGYQRHAKTPAGTTEWRRAWDEVSMKNHKKLEQYLSADHGKAGDFYRLCLASADLKRGPLDMRALQPMMSAIDGVHDITSLMEVAAQLHAMNVPVFFDWEVLADPMDPTRSVLRLLPGGWTLPDYTMYISERKAMISKREQLEDIVTDVLVISGYSKEVAAASARAAVRVEQALAALVSPEDVAEGISSGIPIYANTTRLGTLAPHVDLPLFWQRVAPSAHIGVGKANILVDDVDFFSRLDRFLPQCAKRPQLNSACSIDDARAYLRFRFTYMIGPYLGPEFLNAGRKMQLLLTGKAAEIPSWENCVQATNAALPDAVGSLFVKHTMGERMINAANEMVGKLKDSFRSSLRRLPWMSPQAKNEAIAKLDAMEMLVIGPQQWEKYDDVVVSGGNVTFISAGISAQRALVLRAFARLQPPVDRKRWPATVSVVSANVFYSQELNALYVPAGILQPPFFSTAAVPARNFGSLGAIIIQEMTHAFDETGRFYDSSSKLHNWWQKDDATAFAHRAACVAGLFTHLAPPLSLLSRNYQSSMRDDVADIGGVQLSYQALFDGASGLGWGKLNGGVGGSAPSLGEKQLFFVSWAQTWCSKIPVPAGPHREKYEARIPAEAYRAFGPLTQMVEFSRSFGCPVNTVMNPVHRCPQIW